MSDKRKKRVRELAAKLSISYQAADNILKAGRRSSSPPIDAEQIIRSFYVDGAITLSARCNRCGRWICCGKEERDGVCTCGQRYHVVFGEKNWALVEKCALFIGSRCMDCGAGTRLRNQQNLSWQDYSRIYPEHRRHDPWHATNDGQMQCNRCSLLNRREPSDTVVVRNLPFRLRGIHGDQLPPVGIRRLFRNELADAAVEAERHLFELTEGDVSLALRIRPDLDSPEDVGIIARAFRDAGDPTKPAFPSAQWINQEMTPYEVKALVGFYFETVGS
jgi:hypothetical protein